MSVLQQHGLCLYGIQVMQVQLFFLFFFPRLLSKGTTRSAAGSVYVLKNRTCSLDGSPAACILSTGQWTQCNIDLSYRKRFFLPEQFIGYTRCKTERVLALFGYGRVRETRYPIYAGGEKNKNYTPKKIFYLIQSII